MSAEDSKFVLAERLAKLTVREGQSRAGSPQRRHIRRAIARLRKQIEELEKR